MKILFLSPTYYFKGGAERCLIDMMANPDIVPILTVPKLGEISDYADNLGIKYYEIPFGNIESIKRPFSFFKGLKALYSVFLAGIELKKIIKEESVSIVHSNGLKAHVINCFTKIISSHTAIVHIHDIPLTKSEKIIWRMMQLVCTKMLIVSRPCWPSKKLPKNVKVLHNGMEIIKYQKLNNSNYSSRKLTLGFCGRIHPAKGLHILLEWLHVAQKRNFNLELEVRGSFSTDAPFYEDQIKKTIQKNNAESYVSFRGFISDQDELYKNLDIVVVPSHIPDPLPRSVMEAMGRGLIVFGYPAGGITEMIVDNETGFLVKDQASFEQAILKLRASDDLCIKIIEQSIKKIQTEFSLESLYKNLNEIYKTNS